MKNPLDFLLDDTRCAALAPAALGALARLSLRYLHGDDLPADNEAVRMLAGVDPEQWPMVLDALLPFLASDAAGNLRIVRLLEAKEAAARRSESARRSVAARWQRVRDTNVIRTYPERITNVLDADQQTANGLPTTTPPEMAPIYSSSAVAPISMQMQNAEERPRRRTVFAPPTSSDVEAFMREHTDATTAATQAPIFCDHYVSVDWRVGGRAQMKNWHGAARNWLRRQQTFSAGRITTRSTAATPKTGLRNKVYDDWKRPNSPTTTPTVLL